MRVDLFDYELPPERIAQYPAEPRDSSRLLILNRESGSIGHRSFRDIVHELRAGDTLVLNDTRVLPARLLGRREKTGGHWEGLFLAVRDDGWELMTRTRGKPLPGEIVRIDRASWNLELISKTAEGTWIARPSVTGTPADLLPGVGHIPLPPYIRGGKDEENDSERYQTVYASSAGAVAAPTAGLHFTPDLLERIRQRGVSIEKVTLHVGPGTFQPVSVDDTADHLMHTEWCELTSEVAQRLKAVRLAGGRVVAVGTTAVRTLETAAARAAFGENYRGDTNLFITPPYDFKAVDAMITNFHLPKSTLLMLVSAFAGRERILDAYRDAIREGYRFYSYGDAMFIQ